MKPSTRPAAAVARNSSGLSSSWVNTRTRRLWWLAAGTRACSSPTVNGFDTSSWRRTMSNPISPVRCDRRLCAYRFGWKSSLAMVRSTFRRVGSVNPPRPLMTFDTV